MPWEEQPIRGGKSATVSVAASDTLYKAGADFIADGTCDEVEINAAIAALPASGGEIYLCEGTYNVCGPITIDKDNVTIIGAGASTVIRVRDGHNANLNVIEATNQENLFIKDLRIDGNRANQTAGTMHGIYFDTVTHSKVESCWLENMSTGADGDGIHFETSTDNTIEGCHVLNNVDDGIQLINSDNNTVVGNTFSGNQYGIALTNVVEGNTVTGNTCTNNTFDGISLLSSDGNTVTGNTCTNNTRYGIALTDSDHNIATGNTCVGNGSYGILIHGSIGTIVADNIYEGNTDGIYIIAGSPHSTITGNTITGNANYGIIIFSSDNTTIAGNECRGNGQYGISLSLSSDCTVVGNTVVNNGLNADITYDGIFLMTSDYNNIQGNTIRTTVAAPPPNRQRYGINIFDAGSTGNLVANNDLHQSGQTGGYNDAGTDTRGTFTGEISPTGNTLVVAASDSLDPVRADYYCDGTADQVEINAAREALGATGGTVKLLEGTFTVDGAINLRSNMALVGQGAGTVITIPDGHDAAIQVIYALNNTRMLIKDLRIDGNKANQTAGVMYGIYFNAVTYSKIINCWIGDMYAGRGISLITSSEHNLITGNTCTGNDLPGIVLDNSNNHTIEGNTIEGNGTRGILLLDGCERNTIVGNTIEGNQTHGIELTGACNHNGIVGNIVVNNQNYGIELTEACNHNGIVGNIVVNNSLGVDNTYDGIQCTNNCDYNNIQDNTIRTTTAVPPPNRQRYGISVSDAACDGNLVKDNDLYQAGQTGAFQDLGTGTRLPSIMVPIFDDSDANVTLSNVGNHVVLDLADNQDTHVRFNFRVPSDFHQLVRARIVITSPEDGDLYWGVATGWGLCEESPAAGGDAIALHAEAVTAGVLECLDINAALDGITAGDHVGVNFQRDATNILDTIDDIASVLQFWMQYV